jgi:hypothetical protein
MRVLLAAIVVALTACAEHPPADTGTHRVKVDASNIVEVQRAGYTIMNKNGERLYCSKDPKTGTHLQVTTTCLTEQEWQQVHDATRRTLQTLAPTIAPPQTVIPKH